MLNLVRLHALNYVKDDGSPRKHKEATYQVCPVWYPPVTLYWLRVEYLVWSSRCLEFEMQELELDTIVCIKIKT